MEDLVSEYISANNDVLCTFIFITVGILAVLAPSKDIRLLSEAVETPRNPL